jgi:hypothetical protein
VRKVTSSSSASHFPLFPNRETADPKETEVSKVWKACEDRPELTERQGKTAIQ